MGFAIKKIFDFFVCCVSGIIIVSVLEVLLCSGVFSSMSCCSSFSCISRGYFLSRLDGFSFSKWLLLSKLCCKGLFKLLWLSQCLKLLFWFVIKSCRLNVFYWVDLLNCLLLFPPFSELCWLTGFSVIQFFINHSYFLENSCCDFSSPKLYWFTHSLRSSSEMCSLKLRKCFHIRIDLFDWFLLSFISNSLQF